MNESRIWLVRLHIFVNVTTSSIERVQPHFTAGLSEALTLRLRQWFADPALCR